MEIIHKILLLLLVITSLAIFLTINPVHSVLYLILCFILSSIILIMYGVEFVGLLFIMVYVGAIAVLFLFVIMMINTKTKNKTFWEFNDIPIIITLSGIILTNIYVNFNEVFSKHPKLLEKHYFNFEYIPLDNISNIESIGQILFNHYYMAVFIAGLILLVALIGGIKLTIEFKKSKDTSNQNNKQLSKNKESTHSFQ